MAALTGFATSERMVAALYVETGGCFAAALIAVRNYGGVIEHPADSNAWEYFGLMPPRLAVGWSKADSFGGWTCRIEQGFYGHFSNKPTWLYAVDVECSSLLWGRGEQKLPQWMIDRYGYEKARRCGVIAMRGGKDKTKVRNATPEPFRDLLLSIARSARPGALAVDTDQAAFRMECGR